MSLFSALNTSQSGLNASQIAVSTTSHNISNVNNESYTRQRVEFNASVPFHTQPGDIGMGVSVTSISRIHDEFVYARLKSTSNALSYDTTSQKILTQVAQYFPDLQDVGIAKDLMNYFNAWNDLASNATEGSQKIALLQATSTLVDNIKTSRQTLRNLQDSINGQIQSGVDEINSIGQKIVELNKQINQVESIKGSQANDLRDQRDALELDLAKWLNFSIYKGDLDAQNDVNSSMSDQGMKYYLNIEGNSFIDGISFHPLVLDNSSNASAYYAIYAQSQDGTRYNLSEKLSGGKLGAMLDLRGRSIDASLKGGFPQDGLIQNDIDNLDSFAKTLIESTNTLYSQSAQPFMQTPLLKGITDKSILKNAYQGLETGSFDIIIFDQKGDEVARKSVTLNALTTMKDDSLSQSIVTQINQNSDDNSDGNALNDVDDYFLASFNTGGVLSLDAKSALGGYTIAIEDHGTHFAGVLGLSQFFIGSNAQNIDINNNYKKDPSAIQGYEAPVLGNNTIANAMVQLQYTTLTFNHYNGTNTAQTLEGFYRFMTANMATDAQKATSHTDTTDALYNTVYNEYQSISGVNVDEELMNLMKYQTAYSANAKVISTIDHMLDTLLGLKPE